MKEDQNVEYKESWRDEYLKWIAGFANAQGGKILIGINDKGSVIGVEDCKKLMDDIPNKAVNHLGLIVDVNLHNKSDKNYIEISVPPSTMPVSYHGTYFYRSGSTKQELKGNALHQFLLKKMGVSWEQKPIPNATLNDIDENAIQAFLKKALAKQRISENAARTDTMTLLKNLGLVSEEGDLLLAALLLFGKNPKKYEPAAFFKIGRFGKSHSDLKFQDIVEGNILEMADKVMEILDRLYLIRPISYKGLQRIEGLEYPEQALREAILNAIIHKDYSGTTIFLSVYDDRLMIWNPGTMPASLPIEKLKEKHESKPYNRLIANVFFMAGYIESWGRGIDIMLEGCKDYGLPEPHIEEDQGGIRVTFLKDTYLEKHLASLNLNDRQIKAIQYLLANGKITNAIYQQLTMVARNTATRDLKELMIKGLILSNDKKGVGAEYTLLRN